MNTEAEADQAALDETVTKLRESFKTRVALLDVEIAMHQQAIDVLKATRKGYAARLKILRFVDSDAEPAPPKTFVCDQCPKAFATDQGRIVHKNRMHKTYPLARPGFVRPDAAPKVPAAASVRDSSGQPRDPVPARPLGERVLRCTQRNCDFACDTANVQTLVNHASREHGRAATREERTPVPNVTV